MKYTLSLAIAFAALSFAEDNPPCPMHDQHRKEAQTQAQAKPDDHHAGVNHRGDKAMGFSHEKTTHHFHLYKDGGAIEVAVNDANDAANRDEIRGHLTHIAKLFSDGNFEIPMFIHDRETPGSQGMKERKERIQYRFEQTGRGALVRIVTKDKKALQAVHEFLRFQITDHRTGDKAEVTD